MTMPSSGGWIGRAALLGSIAAAAACGSDGAGVRETSPPADTELGGVYELTRFTENDTDCAAEGGSILDRFSHRHFVIAPMLVLGELSLVLSSCEGIEDCQDKARKLEDREAFGSQYSFVLATAVSQERAAGFAAGTGTSHDGRTCTERTHADHELTRVSSAAVRLESRTKRLADRPAEDSACVVTPADSRTEAAALPCSTLRVLEGTRVADGS